jgi:hypothetical protein
MMLNWSFDHAAQAFGKLLGLLPFSDQGTFLTMPRNQKPPAADS